MGVIKLVINECIKIFKKKSTIVLLILSILALLFSYGIICLEKNSEAKYTYTDGSIEFMQYELKTLKNEFKTANEEKQIKLNFKIETYEYAIENNILIRSIDRSYKEDLVAQILAKEDTLNSIDKNIMEDEYIDQVNKISKLNEILKSDSFESYIEYNKEKIKNDYDNKILTEEEYNDKIEQQNFLLKYEIGKYPSKGAASWKETLLYDNSGIDTTLRSGYDYQKKEYLTNDRMLQLQGQKMINTYRLDNNISPNHERNSLKISESYYRWNYDNIAISASMFFITLLFIILASSSISEETSKGTIKFLLITPFKRYQILLAKLISYILILILTTFILSQINVLLGNLLFPNTVNDYIFVSNNKIGIINTNLYITLQYMLKLPEVIIYILLGITLSTLTRSTTIANTITVIVYTGTSIAVNAMKQVIKIDFLKYLPFCNFDLKSKVFYFDISKSDFFANAYEHNNTLQFSLIVLGITMFLLLVTMFESFNKKDIV